MLSVNEKAFLAYFIPLLGLKLMDITAENVALKLVGIACFIYSLSHIIECNYGKKVFNVLAVLLCYSSLLVVTCGKQAMFFSTVMIILMYRINLNRKIYSILFKSGVFFLLIYVCHSYISGSAESTTRYLNGEWVEMNKRSNMLYVSYTAVLCLYLLVNRNNVTYVKLLFIILGSILMFFFVGSRTGLLVSLFLVLMLFGFKFDLIRRNIIIKWLCILSPLYSFLFCVYTGLFYEKHLWLLILDKIQQGRIYQNSLFMHDYQILPFGQHLMEKYGENSNGEYLNLDCGYLDLLLCEGFVFAFLWVTITIILIKHYYEKKKMVEVSILVMYAFYEITENFLPNCFLNPSLFLYGEYLYSKLKVTPEFHRIYLVKFK